MLLFNGLLSVVSVVFCYSRWVLFDAYRHTSKRILERLIEFCKKEKNCEFNCSYRLVCSYVSEKKKELYKTRKDAFLPLEHIPGEAQIDFGDAEFVENGLTFEGSYLCVSFPHSNAGYTQIFKGKNQECLFEGMKSMFNHIGGVPSRIWFDNMSTAVVKILKEGKRINTDGFLRFANHYGFEAVFCNPNAGHEKGNVENKVGYTRRNLFVPIPEFKDIEEYNVELLARCNCDNDRIHYYKPAKISELFEKDIESFLPLPSCNYDTAKYLTVKTTSYGKFTLEAGKHIYSTTPQYSNSVIIVKISANKVHALDKNYQVVATHRRLYGGWRQESMDWIPYLTQLSKRPRALKYTGIYKMLPDVIQNFLNKCEYSEQRQALQILSDLTEKSSFNKAVNALKLAVERNSNDIDSVIAIFNKTNEKQIEITDFVPSENIPKLEEFKVNTLMYDKLFLIGGASA